MGSFFERSPSVPPLYTPRATGPEIPSVGSPLRRAERESRSVLAADHRYPSGWRPPTHKLDCRRSEPLLVLCARPRYAVSHLSSRACCHGDGADCHEGPLALGSPRTRTDVDLRLHSACLTGITVRPSEPASATLEAYQTPSLSPLQQALNTSPMTHRRTPTPAEPPASR